MNAFNDTIKIEKTLIPMTDLSDAGYLRWHPGGVAKTCTETLKNGSRLLDYGFWHRDYTVRDQIPNFAWEN